MRTYQFTDQQELVQHTVKLYNSNLTTFEIAKLLNKSRPTICLYLKYAGIETRKSYRKLDLDIHFFNVINTHEKAYWLGFLLAYRHANKRHLRLELQRRDESHIYWFLKDIGSSSKVRQHL
jgi:intein-encoded DNA endonuclease-like protein